MPDGGAEGVSGEEVSGVEVSHFGRDANTVVRGGGDLFHVLPDVVAGRVGGGGQAEVLQVSKIPLLRCLCEVLCEISMRTLHVKAQAGQFRGGGPAGEGEGLSLGEASDGVFGSSPVWESVWVVRVILGIGAVGMPSFAMV